MSDQKGGDDFQQKTDSEHLKILSIIWYVVAGLQALGICAGIGYILMGLGVAGGGGDAAAAGGIFMCMGVGVLVISIVGVTLSVMTARSLAARKRHLLCLIWAGITCLSIPIGTILGIFTIMVLLRPSVKQAFGVAS